MLAAVALGLGLGFTVAAQVGPISLLCIRSVLRGAFLVGVAIGAGAAVVDVLYASLGIAGASRLLEVDALRIALGVTGAVVLAVLAVRTVRSAVRIRLGAETDDEVASPRRAFLTSLGATASNPLTIASWAAIFSAASTADLVSSGGAAFAILLGVGLGTLGWFTALSGGLALARSRVGPRLLTAVDVIAAAVLLAFSVLLGYRTLADSDAP
ncbi:MAG TPA: LysE family transporter [Gaiellaceae bacterium]|jgi:putative LysE/RhtB family amino acid efflux pump